MKNTVDLMKIDRDQLGVINLNNMLSLLNDNYILLDIEKYLVNEKELKYRNLLNAQLKWMNSNYDKIIQRALRLYNLYKYDSHNENIRKRCCDFKLLELKCVEYSMKSIHTLKDETYEKSTCHL